MKKSWLFILVLLIAAGGGAYYYNQQQLDREPEGLARSNGRLQLERVDVAGLFAGRVENVYVREGDKVQKDAELVSLSSDQYDSQLDAAIAQRTQAEKAVAQAEAEIKARQEQLRLAQVELSNANTLRRDRLISATELNKRQIAVSAQQAAVEAAEAGKAQAEAAVMQAQAQIDASRATTRDLVIKAPIDGTVEYRFAHPGNVVAAGHPVVSLLDPSDTRMFIYLPTEVIGQITLGEEARLQLDGQHYIWPAYISFISAQAQFTPKTVETTEERQKLMYRVELRIPSETAIAHQDYLKSGLTGMGYVKTGAEHWPTELEVTLP
ncbi:MAG: HlyD family efflux transporter periplasmic adaptor subunit [Alcaligenaceae bacterium]|nr:HlyD family efflux transporter periplasmic adaptor subunit [Alcaligenaceae bacterium]